MELFEEEIRRLEAVVNTHAPGSIVFYGSSTIRLWASLQPDFPHTDLINAGFGGSTLAACAWYFERVVVPARPRSVILYAGDNDIGENRQPEEIYLFFCALADKMQRLLPGIPLWFIGIKPSPARWAMAVPIRAANAAIAHEITRLPNATFIDLSAVMLDEHNQPRQELFDSDGLHLSTAGYALWQRELRQRCTDLQE